LPAVCSFTGNQKKEFDEFNENGFNLPGIGADVSRVLD
jgi:hypothetical protein